MQHRLQMCGLRILQPFAELRCLLTDRFAHGREGARVGILCGELPELIVSIHQFQRVLAHVVHFIPPPVQFR